MLILRLFIFYWISCKIEKKTLSFVSYKTLIYKDIWRLKLSTKIVAQQIKDVFLNLIKFI